MNTESALRDRSFLIVEDEPFSRVVLERILYGLEPLHLRSAGGTTEALEQLKKLEAVDCVITDFAMEPLNGLDLLKAIRTGKAGVRRDLPVVMLTGFADAALIGAALALDANAFIAKPASQQGLRERLVRVFSEPPNIRAPLAYAVIPTRLKATKKATPEAAAPEAAPSPDGEKHHRQHHRHNATGGPAVAERFAAAAAVGAPPRPKPPPMEKYKVGDVPVGSVLARELKTGKGQTLIAADSTLSADLLARLRDLWELGVVDADEVWVRAKS